MSNNTTIPPVEEFAQRGAGAKIRIMKTSDRLFYGIGIRAVGIDLLISEAKVTKATFYKYAGSKDHLIVQYIEARDIAMRERLQDIADAASSPQEALRTFASEVAAAIAQPDFRGSAFLNAAAEFSDREHPVRKIVEAHRDWVTEFLADIVHKTGHKRSGDSADDLMLACDGALSGAYAGDAIAATAALLRAVERVIAEAD